METIRGAETGRISASSKHGTTIERIIVAKIGIYDERDKSTAPKKTRKKRGNNIRNCFEILRKE